MAKSKKVQEVEVNSEDDDQHDSADYGKQRVSWEARRKYLNEKYANELHAAASMSPEELRRLRRRISNRESARRLRKQRSEKLGELQEQQGSLEDKFSSLSDQILEASTRLQLLEAENAALQAQLNGTPMSGGQALGQQCPSAPPTAATTPAPKPIPNVPHVPQPQQPSLKRTADDAALDAPSLSVAAVGANAPPCPNPAPPTSSQNVPEPHALPFTLITCPLAASTTAAVATPPPPAATLLAFQPPPPCQHNRAPTAMPPPAIPRQPSTNRPIFSGSCTSAPINYAAAMQHTLSSGDMVNTNRQSASLPMPPPLSLIGPNA